VNIIAVDWGKDARKRSAYISRLASRTISRLPFDGSLVHLIEHASSLDGPVLVGIDAAIGFPASSWQKLHDHRPHPPRTFADFLLGSSLPTGFFEPVSTPAEWSPQRPFIRPPSGRWSLQAFVDASHQGLYRQIDKRLHANPIFVTSGIPGTVGSGTRALWLELIRLTGSGEFRVWPFHGTLATLLTEDAPVIAEIYPKACYGIALAESLPARLSSIAKTKEHARQAAIGELQNNHWLARKRITINDFDAALKNEDDFDALLSAAALTRILLEEAPIESPETVDDIAEGGVLGAASLTTRVKRIAATDQLNMTGVPKPPLKQASKSYPCPIAGCTHVFRNSRGGWDAHVSSLSRHPTWHPEATDPVSRKLLFKKEFPEWFGNPPEKQ
jgi:hypothetical protein